MHACSQQCHSQSQKAGTTIQVIFYQLTSGQTNVAHPRRGMWFCPRRTRHWHGLQRGPAVGTRAQWEAETKGPGALLHLHGRPRTGKPRDRKQSGSCRGWPRGRWLPRVHRSSWGWGCLGTRWWWWFTAHHRERTESRSLTHSEAANCVSSKGSLTQEWREKFLEALSWKTHREL